MELKKAKIYRRDTRDFVEVLFNPTEYQLTQSNQFSEVAIPGLGGPLLQFARGNSRTLSMQLFFDTFEKQTDVRDETGKLIKLMKIDSDLHAPPVLEFFWGTLALIGVLEQANQRFTLFLPNGTPVRATMDITLKEFWDPQEQGGRLKSANFSKLHVVSRGENLAGMAAKYYDNSTLWRKIAEANNIDDPRSLRPGQRLEIPAIE